MMMVVGGDYDDDGNDDSGDECGRGGDDVGDGT
jgi:hypothetical protein